MPEPASSPNDPPLLSPGVRSAISLVLFIHLFCLWVAMCSYVSPSGLQMRLRQVVGPYLRLFNFDLNHVTYSPNHFYLTHAQQTDIDFRVTVTTPTASGTAETTVLPEPDLWHTARYRRQLNLANTIGSIVGVDEANEAIEGILPQAVAATDMRRLGAAKNNIVVRGRYLPSLEQIESANAEESNPDSPRYFRDVFTADVFKVGDQINLLKASTRGEVAPVEKGAAKP